MFIVDKDFTQLSSIEKYFTGCTILLCQFHTLKFMRPLLATALETVEKKNELYAMFKRVVYAPSEESYNAENPRGVRSENIRHEGWVGGVSMSEK